MASVLARLRERRAAPTRNAVGVPVPAAPERSSPLSLDDYATLITQAFDDWQQVSSPITQTWRNEPAERVGTSMKSLAETAYKSNGLAFSLIAVRMVAFSLARFSWQRMRKGRPADLFGTPGLTPLETPWPGGTTQDLLMRMLLDADLAGNAYIVRDGPWLLRLRPDWVQILLEPILHNGCIVGYRRVGYTYHHGGIEVCPPEQVALYTAREVAHFAPIPDPDASYRGMSWLNPVVREVSNDKTMERHKSRFFENAATPNLSVSLDKSVSPDDFAAFKAVMDEEHVGIDNAYKTLYLGGGADVKVIGANFQQLEMNAVQGRGETRVAAAAGVPPIIVGFSEGLNSATYSNYSQAMRRFADLTMASLWGNAAGSLAPVVTPPGSDSRLWYDTRDVAFLREDRDKAAEVQGRQAQTIRTLIDAGYLPDSVVAAVEAEDFTLLVHSRLFSVQLQPAGADAGTDADSGGGDAPDPDAPAGDDEPAGDDTAPATGTNATEPAPLARTLPVQPVTLPPLDVDVVDREIAANGHHPALVDASPNGAQPT